MNDLNEERFSVGMRGDYVSIEFDTEAYLHTLTHSEARELMNWLIQAFPLTPSGEAKS